MGVLRQATGGMPVAELCREHGMSSASFYKWRSKYGGMDASMISCKCWIEFPQKCWRKIPHLSGSAISRNGD
jgi:putative transposase